MDIHTALKDIIASRNSTSRTLARECGVLPTSLANMGSRGTYKLSFLCRALDVLGYEVAFLPKGVKRVSGGYYFDKGMDITRED